MTGHRYRTITTYQLLLEQTARYLALTLLHFVRQFKLFSQQVRSHLKFSVLQRLKEG